MQTVPVQITQQSGGIATIHRGQPDRAQRTIGTSPIERHVARQVDWLLHRKSGGDRNLAPRGQIGNAVPGGQGALVPGANEIVMASPFATIAVKVP